MSIIAIVDARLEPVEHAVAEDDAFDRASLRRVEHLALHRSNGRGRFIVDRRDRGIATGQNRKRAGDEPAGAGIDRGVEQISCAVDAQSIRRHEIGRAARPILGKRPSADE